MRFQATFTGTTGHGYVNGREHTLHVLQTNGKPRIVKAEPSGQCPMPYASWAAFWQNWERS